jgi:hypothetical protein
MIDQTRNYNELIPPSNPEYPWVPAGWQVLCYYCNQPIYLTKPEALHRQHAYYIWLHVTGDAWGCSKEKLRPTAEIDDPRCTCHTQTNEHAGACSAAGKPPFRAMPMDAKEEELRRLYGWGPVFSGPTR